MPERRTAQIKAPIADKAQSNRCAHGASFSKAIVKIGNAAMRRSELAHFNKQMLIHELIRDSPSSALRALEAAVNFVLGHLAGKVFLFPFSSSHVVIDDL